MCISVLMYMKSKYIKDNYLGLTFGIFITQSLQYFSFIYLFNNALITFYNTYIGIIKKIMAKNPKVGQS